MGSRMRSLTHDEIPKPMLLLNGKPMLQWQIENLAEYGIRNLVIITGHLGERIKEYFGDGSGFGVSIQYIEEKEPLGSAGALYFLKERFKDKDYLLIFGDVMFCLDWDRLITFHEGHRAMLTTLAHPNSHPFDSDLLITGENDQVLGIDSKNNNRTYWYENCVNAGIYAIDRSVVEKITGPRRLDLEKDILKPFLGMGAVYAYRSSEYVKDAGTPERFEKACIEQQKGVWEKRCLRNKQRCIFLDRDGTINKYRGLISREEELELETAAAEAIRRINEAGYLAIVITNQPVVARGMCSIETVMSIHRKMSTLLGNEGAYLDDIAFCPHHPDKGYPEENPIYKVPCSCRKPAIGMIEAMAVKYNIDLGHSWIIGDSTTDIQTGINAGLGTFLVRTGQAGRDGKYEVQADLEGENLLAAVEKII